MAHDHYPVADALLRARKFLVDLERHLAEAHGGRVRAESTVGRGTTIAALFPFGTTT